MKLDYSIDPKTFSKKPKENQVDEKQVDFQLFNDFQQGLQQDLNQKKQDIELAQQAAVQGGQTVS